MPSSSAYNNHLADPRWDAGLQHEIELADLLSIVRRRSRLIIGIVGTIMIVVGICLFMASNMYTSSATVLPSGQMDKMSDLKALAGLGGILGSNDNSSDLFPTILQSRTVLDAVLDTEYQFEQDGKTMTVRLPEYLGQDNPDRLRDALKRITSVATDKKTGVITVTAETKYPGLSRAVVGAYLAELENFNLHKRRSQAKDNVAYLSRQLEVSRADLAAAEDSLETIQRANRNWNQTDNPDLMKLLARMQRTVEIQNSKFLFLTQEYESARFEMQKDVPIVRVLDAPSLPTLKSGPKRLTILLVVFTLTLGATVFGTVFYEFSIRRLLRNSSPLSSLSSPDSGRASFSSIDAMLERDEVPESRQRT